MLIMCWNMSSEKSESELRSAAIALYDIGLRPSDKTRMTTELGLPDHEVDIICMIMKTLNE